MAESRHNDDDVKDKQTNFPRRRILTVTTAGLGVAGTIGLLVPFAGSLAPSEKAKAAGAPVEVDISQLQIGQRIVVEWRGKPVWVIKRSTQILDLLPELNSKLADPDSTAEQQPQYASNAYRSIREDIVVLVGICTHLGCSPAYRPQIGATDFDENWKGGFLCACHGSKFDLAGRVYKGVPAPTNLIVPPHQYLSDDRLLIGDDSEVSA